MKRLIAVMVLVPFIGSAFALVNVNTAQQSELQRTKGLDRYKAKSIIEYRSQNGPILSLEELQRVPGLSKEDVDKVASQVAFNGPPYVPSKVAANDKSKKKG